MIRPNEHSTVEEIKSYVPKGWSSGVSWFYRKKELLRLKKLKKCWEEWTAKS